MVSPGALEGITVIEVTSMLSGPYAGMILRDHGARVIKVEPPGGEASRGIGPHPDGAPGWADGGYGAYYNAVNRGKESILLDLKTDSGKTAFRALAAKADVVLENYRPGVMDRLGLGFEALRADNPRLVWGAIRGFGDPRTGASPLADWPAYDVVAQAMGGIMGITGSEAGGTPTKLGPGLGDTVPAMQLVIGILAALLRARATGRGQWVDVAMVDGVLAVCERMVFQHGYTGASPGVEGNHHPLLVPFGIFPAADGWVALGAPRDDIFAAMARLIGRDDLADSPDWSMLKNRLTRRDAVIALFSDWTRQRTRAEIASVMGGKVPFGPLMTAAEIADHPHTAAREMIVPVGHAGTDQTFAVAGTPIKLAETPGGPRGRAPRADEHRNALIAEFGLPADL